MRVLFITIFIVLVDQISKLYIKGFTISSLGIYHDGMTLYSTETIIDGFLHLTFIENPGMAFGIDIGAKFFFSFFTILASIGIFYYLYISRNTDLVYRMGLAFILGGSIGNLIDRVFYGYFYDYAPLMYGKVVDFIDVSFGSYHWFIFNIADSSVTIGIIILFLHSFIFSKNKNKELETV